ncbi:Ger(x)C family spore germination protein [Bacillus infantis]|uniref:Ger(x)C family spore germination protein n=1 Tax=Bacillus infantis TaxID=324767 RepID=UPI001CD27C36|nr:Ger(x)C family spore germination protein [Bacillus infantis]MCA1034866.1 Ger(x)C family spore germination protein [Bacillus infantis]
MRTIKLAWLLIIVLILGGCWDERLLKNSRLVYISAFDLTENGKYETTSIIRNTTKVPNPQQEATNEIAKGEGLNIRDTRLTINRSLAGEFDPSKSKVLILGEELAKRDIYTVLDIVYRIPRTPIIAKVAVADGSAGALLAENHKNEPLLGEFLYELLLNSEKSTEIQELTVQNICTILFDEGKDFMVPFIKNNDENKKIEVSGSALFHDRIFTGKVITPEQSSLLMLFMDKMNKECRFAYKLSKGETVTFAVNKVKRDLHYTYSYGRAVFKAVLSIDINIEEYPLDHLHEKKIAKELAREISQKMSDDAKGVFSILKEEKADLLGVGRELIAFHPDIWENIKGSDYYAKVDVKPEVRILISGNGIIN